MAGKLTFGGNAVYVATKHGVVGFARAVWEDVRDRGVKVCAICPGFVSAGAALTIPGATEDTFAKLIQPDDIAHAVRFVATFPATACPTEILLSPQIKPFS